MKQRIHQIVHRIVLAGLLPLVLLMQAGCPNSGPGIRLASGTVTLDGNPVPLAEIWFVPKRPGEANPGRPMQLKVRNGKYDSKPVGIPAGENIQAELQILELQVADPLNMTPEEQMRYMTAPRTAYRKMITVDSDELNLAYTAADKGDLEVVEEQPAAAPARGVGEE